MRTAALGGFAVDYQSPPSTEDFRRPPRTTGSTQCPYWHSSSSLAGWMVDITLHALPNLGPFPLRPYFSINDRRLKQPTRINDINSLPPILETYGNPSRYFSRLSYCTFYIKSWLYMFELFRCGRSFHSYIRNRKDTERMLSREILEGKLEAPK